ncbi:MAG: hypothetical protein WBR18_08170 [Anaerolineales bacterium]
MFYVHRVRSHKGERVDIQADDLVLVAVVPSVRDLEIARLLGWYRIPLETAPKTVRVDWLALYQTAALPNEKWSVRCVAPVLGHELVRRVDLLQDEPHHPRAEAPYHKLQLGSLVQLPHAIRAAGWRRFTFLYTTGDRLQAAETLKDLTVPSSSERQRLWRIIRERSA